MTDPNSASNLPILPGMSLPSSGKTIPFPNGKTITQPAKKIIPKPKLPQLPISPQTNKNIEPPTIIIENSTSYIDNLENELYQLGYIVINKIIAQKLQFLKAINKKGQKVYIYLDTVDNSYVSDNDIMILENNNNLLSYSTKNGAYNCVGTDVSGVVFEYGTNSICTIMRGENDLKSNEVNYVFDYDSQSHNPSFEGCVVTYPIIKLSELRVNPDIILCNTDIVVRRLRNAEDSYERQELARTDNALEELNESLCNFKEVCNNSTHRLICSIQDLKNLQEQQYDEQLRKDLVRSNDNIVKLICVMKKVASTRREMEKITHEIKELTNYLDSQI